MNRPLRHLPWIAAAFALAAVVFAPAPPALATIASSPCAGNVCTGTLVVGGQSVNYSYTQHLSSGGQFRIRLNGGVYNTNGLVSFIIYDMPAFTSTGYLANPNNGATAMSEVDVNPGRTAYERRSSAGCSSCIYDHVMSVQYSSLTAGTYAFSLSIIQNGDTGGLVNLPFYVDATAPSNGNESNVFSAVSGMDYPCADGIDNDLNFKADCADPACTGAIGKVSTGAVCQIPETTCNDGFDNDGDGKTDCLDPDCNGRVGQPSGTALCQYGNEFGASTCVDNFDNDGDGLVDCLDNVSNDSNVTHTCWKQSAYGCPATESNCTDNVDNDKDKSYDANYDAMPLTGVDCKDYDCAGNAACPAQENKTAGGVGADAQCFDGVDNDLDHLTDCADNDCKGVINPGNTLQICYDKEFDLGQRYQFCDNNFDDDGDGPIDCADTDCKQRFGNCGPCPAREDYQYQSCADGRDNDTDGVIDCADSNCANKIGSTSAAAICSVSENTGMQCSDAFDNDGDGLVDCADPGCNGLAGPLGQTCQPAGETSCTDGKDNDADGLIDCVDPNCFGVGGCAAASWTQSSCQIVPRYTSPSTFTSNAPTVTATVRVATHVSDIDTIRITGSATYASVTVIVGDNTDPTKYYPYAAASPNCKIVDIGTCAGYPYTGGPDPFSCPNAARLSFLPVAGHAVEIYNTAGPNLAGFDAVLVCRVPATPAAATTYPISLSVLKEPSDVAEYGDVNFSTTLLEATMPTVSSVQPEGFVGSTVSVPYGGVSSPASRRFRGVPSDAGAGLNASGICHCDIDISGVTGTPFTTTGSCVTAPLTFMSDASVTIKGRAEDGANNLGAYSAGQSFTINVTPALQTPITIGPAKPFYKTGVMTMTFDGWFATGGSDFFGGTCAVYVRDDNGNIVNGPVGPTASFAGSPIGNTLRCSGSITLPSMTDGRYYVTIRAQDNDGDSADSNRQVMYMCNTVPAAGDAEPTNGCQYADFDSDGAAEGLYTTLYSTAPKSCDNCIGLSNPSQQDANANGVGDVCEPNDTYGRCEIDRDIVCSWDSNDAAHGCPGGSLCCPGPSVGLDYSAPSPPAPPYPHKNPQVCKLTWGLCLLEGTVCFVDPDCPGGAGKCQDGLTSCYRDADCIAVAGTPACTGADRCDNLLFPWLQTVFGNVFSKKKIIAPTAPPQNQYNATFCITAKDTIFNFNTQGQGGCGAATDTSVRYELPQSSNSYATVLGQIDLAGLRNGKYGPVTTVDGTALATALDDAQGLRGRVLRVAGDVTVTGHTIANATDPNSGAGTVFIDGGNLTITGDIQYSTASVSKLQQLASLGWIAVDNGSGTKGNIYVDGGVTVLSGAFYSGGAGGFYSVNPPATDSPAPLTLYGMLMAHQFHLSRSYKSVTQGSERFIYDGRAVVNPPPGFGDVSKSLPTLTDTPPAP